MTVQWLIDQLSKFPRDMEVYICKTFAFYRIDCVDVDEVLIDGNETTGVVIDVNKEGKPRE